MCISNVSYVRRIKQPQKKVIFAGIHILYTCAYSKYHIYAPRIKQPQRVFFADIYIPTCEYSRYHMYVPSIKDPHKKIVAVIV